MKKQVKREKKKYPYHRNKKPLIAQISDSEKKKRKEANRWAIVTENGIVIEKFIYKLTAVQMLSKYRSRNVEELKIVKISDIVTTKVKYKSI